MVNPQVSPMVPPATFIAVDFSIALTGEHNRTNLLTGWTCAAANSKPSVSNEGQGCEGTALAHGR